MSVDATLRRERRGLCGACRSKVKHQDRCPQGRYVTFMWGTKEVSESGPAFANGKRSRSL